MLSKGSDKLNTNFILGEFLDFYDILDDLESKFSKKTNLKSFTVVILSSHNQEYTYKYCSKNTMENSLFKLKDKFKTMNHIKMKNSNSTLLYELSDTYKFFDKNTYEICLIVNSKFEFESHLTGILYLSTQINNKEISLKEINNPKILSIIEMTFYLIQSKIELYDKLYYTIDLFLEFLSVKKKYLLFHINNVTSWCLKLAKKLELSSKDTLILYVSALMYDLGNIYIPNNILNKNSKLTLDEYEVVKSQTSLLLIMKGLMAKVIHIY